MFSIASGRKRLRAPLFFSNQTRSAEAVGALSFAFFTPYFTPSPILGTGTYTGSYNPEDGRQLFQQQNGQELSYGGLFAGTFAQQNLVQQGYLNDSKKKEQQE